MSTKPKENQEMAPVDTVPPETDDTIIDAEISEPNAASDTVDEVAFPLELNPESEIENPDPDTDSLPSPLPLPEPLPLAKGHKWNEIKILLEKMKEDILIEIGKSVRNGTDAVATNEPGGDIYDQASSERDRELGLLLGDREREKLHSVDEALQRINENEYGVCEECDEDIPLGRLKAMPFTRHCVKCKSDLEKLQAQTKRFEEDRAYREIPLGSEEEDS